MSLPEINLEERLRGSKAISDEIHEKARDVKKAAKTNEQHKQDEAVAHRATMLILGEHGADLQEESSKLGFVIDGPQAEPVVEAPTLVPEPTNTEPQGLVVEPVALEPQPDTAPTATVPAVVINNNGNTKNDGRDPREWGAFAWIAAIFAAFIGLLLAASWPADEWVRANSGLFIIEVIATLLWWVGWPLLFGGLFGSFVARHEASRSTSTA